MKWWDAESVQILPLSPQTWGSIKHFFLSTLETTWDSVINGNMESCF